MIAIEHMLSLLYSSLYKLSNATFVPTQMSSEPHHC